MNIRAKMKVAAIEVVNPAKRIVTFEPIGEPGPENSYGTPDGSATLVVTNPALFDWIQEGQKFHLEFTPAEF